MDFVQVILKHAATPGSIQAQAQSAGESSETSGDCEAGIE
jgi:hypothetical protein